MALRLTIDEWAGSPGAVDPRAMHEYLRCFDPATVHATFEDYRAGATIDLAHDRAHSHRSLPCPTLALWSHAGLGQQYDVAAIWSALAPDLRCKTLDGGHFLAEECPEETARELEALFSRH